METENFTLGQVITVGCGCAACMTGEGSGYTGLWNGQGSMTDPDIGAPTTTASKEIFALYLTDGYYQDSYAAANGNSWLTKNFSGWNDTTLTFSINNYYSATEKQGIRDAFQQWAEVVNVTFTEVSSGGQIYLEGPANGNETGRAFAQTSRSSYDGQEWFITGSRVVIDYDSGGFGNNPTDLGNYALMTAIHEIGHAIGLGHSGFYNAGQGNPTYNSDGQWLNDTRQYSLMSYWSASYSGANHQGEYASTPLVMDIYAAQTLYGANMTTRTGNTVYGFNTNTGSDQFDFTQNTRPVIAIWDAGGTDTLDLSGFTQTQMINLNAGSFSNVGGLTGNLAIAYGVTIENATGGSGQDTFYGNSANNILLGGAGNDTFHGSAGSDTIDGQGNTDTLIYTFNISAFLVSLVDSVTITLQHIAQAWTDTVRNIENFIFNGTTLSWNEVAALAAPASEILAKITVGGTPHDFLSAADGDSYITAAQVGHSGSSGNVFRMQRSGDTLDFHVLQTTAPDRVFFDGDSGNNTINVRGTHAGMTVHYTGDDGDDVLTIHSGVTGNDQLHGGAGNDIMSAGAGDDRLYGDEGNDTLYGGDGADLLNGGAGDDVLYGDAGSDKLYGNEGNDTLYGGDGDDLLRGGAGNDALYGGSGADDLRGEAGNDTIYGGNNDDYIEGGQGNDILYGDAGHDIIHGNDDHDTLYGGDGNDTLYGGNGNDILYGGSGSDRLYGGDGADTFVFEAATAFDTWDQIRDFNVAQGDRIDLSDLLSGFNSSIHDINHFVRFGDTGTHTYVRVDVNGTAGGANFVQIAMLNNTSGLGSVDQLVADGTLII